MINDLLFALWLNIPSALAHASNADNISNKNLSIIKGKLFRVSSTPWLKLQYRIIVICHYNLRPVEMLVCLTNPVDFVTISLDIQSENWRVVTYCFTVEFKIIGDVFKGFT